MALISEVAERIYEIQPEGNCLDRFPLCTVYLIVDDKVALVEAGCAIQTQEIMEAIQKLIDDLSRVEYIFLTHSHPDHSGAAGHLTQRLHNARLISHPDIAKLLADPSMISKMMHGFKLTIGEDAEERFGMMLPVVEKRFLSVKDGETIPLGKRTLRAIHTPGHDPYHFCFLDTMSGGLFCGDAIGGYFSEIDLIVPPNIPGTDFDVTLKSIQKLREFNPTTLFFSHGCTVRDVNKYIQMAENNLKSCQKTVHEGLLAGEDREKIAYKLIDALAKDSEQVRYELSRHMEYAHVGVEAYRLYFTKMNMI